MSQQFQPFLVRISVLTGFMTAALTSWACAPIPAPRAQADAPRRRRGIDVSEPFLAFRGSAEQMGDLVQVASNFRLIAVDADPVHEKFSRNDLATLRAGGQNIVLGILNVGFCDRDQSYWSRASEGLLPCVANRNAQLGERAGSPRRVWMDVEDFEYQRLIGEYVAPRLARAGVDGFLLDGLELLDHSPDDEIPCDDDCVTGGLALIAGLRKEFPDLVFVMQGGLSWRVREARVQKKPAATLIDGIIGEEVYSPAYNPQREADLIAWRAIPPRDGHPLAVLTQDYVKGCDDAEHAALIYKASRSHGFSPSIGLSPTGRPGICRWNLAQ